jgi:cytochrome c peroxidase
MKKSYFFAAIICLTLPLFSFANTTLATPDVDDIEYPDDEPPSQAEVELGKILFFDTRLSSNLKQSCATCHNPELGFSDGLKTSVGTMGGSVSRNAPHLYNLAWASTLFWDGRSSTLEDQALGPIQAAGEMNLPLDVLVPRLSKVAFYKEQFEKIYGEPEITAENIGKAIAAFERTIISDNSPFDQYIAGNKLAMSPAAIRGLTLFKGKANCTSCHDGANFTDDSFHNIGVNNEDIGRAGIVKSEGMNKAFKTPGLRNIAYSAPYMHDGSEGSLEDVVNFYNRGGDNKTDIDKLIKPLNLSKLEVADLVAFMGALSDPIVISRPKVP